MMTPTSIDAQMLVSGDIGGTCNGGNPTQVYKYAHEMGLVHGSCEQYVAHNLESAFESINICMDCQPPVPAAGETGAEGCHAVTPSKMYYIDNYYSVKGEANMKAALQDGPISCGIHATDNFEHNYDGGIYSEYVRFPLINHEISVVGYSVDETG